MSPRSTVQHICDWVTSGVSTVTGAVGLQQLLLKATESDDGWGVVACAGVAVSASAVMKYLAGKRDSDSRRELVAAIETDVQARLKSLKLNQLSDAINAETADPQLRLLALMTQAAAAEGAERQEQLKAIRGVLEADAQTRRKLTAFIMRFEQHISVIQQEFRDSFDAILECHIADTQSIVAELNRLHAPALHTPLAKVVEPIDRFKYNARVVPLLGRERELEQLGAFLDDDRALLWWLWVGDGGVGKSRLMLEFILEAQYRGWAAGFLRTVKSFDPERWKPTDDTLIIVDYVASRPEETRKCIAALHDRAAMLGKKVRFVLLERSATETDQWYRDFCSTGSEQTELNNHRYQPPRQLESPDEESAWKVFAHMVRATDPDSESVSVAQLRALKATFLEHIRERPVQQRPLFAVLAAELVAERGATGFERWETDTLVKLVLEREIETRWKNRVDARHVNLLVLATFIDGLSRRQAYKAAKRVRGLPDMDSLNLQTYRVLTGYDTKQAKHELPPLLPDLLGECFVLERMAGNCAIPHVEGNPDAIRGTAQRALAWAWEISPFSTARSILRVVRDFRHHPQVAELLRHRKAHETIWGAMIADAAGYDLDSSVSDEILQALRQSSAPTMCKAGAYCNRGVAHGQLGNHKTAIVDFTTVIDMPEAPTDERAKALNNRGVAHGELGDLKAEIADYTTVIDMPEAPTDERAKALNNRGVAHGELGDLKAEIADYTTVIDMPEAPTDERARALYNRGVAHSQLGNHKTAIVDFTTVIDMPEAPTDQRAKALNNRGVAHGELGNHKTAIVDFTTVIDMPEAPTDQRAKALNNRGVAHGQLRNHKTAIVDFTTVIDMPEAPTDQRAKALYNRGVAHGKLGDLKAEIADYTTVIDMPEAPTDQRAKALYNRGVAHVQLRNHKRAIVDFTTVIDMPEAPTDQRAKALNNRGVAHGQLGNHKTAIVDFTTVIDMPEAPTDQRAKALYNRGVAHDELGDLKAKIKDVTAILEMSDAPDELKALARKALGALSSE